MSNDDEIVVDHEDAPATSRSAGVKPTPTPLAAGVLAQALAALAAGVCEEPLGSNDGPAVRDYLARCGVDEPAQWCASAASCWLMDAAAELKVEPPVKPSPGALNLAHEFMEKGALIPVHQIAHCAKPGDLVFWRRPPSAWHGHVGVIEDLFVEMDPNGVTATSYFTTIEGNSGPAGDRVARMKRRFDDPLLFGVGRV